MKKTPINGYNFSEKKDRKRMKYLIVFNGDLDLNGAYGFDNQKELRKYLERGFMRIQDRRYFR